MGYNTVPQPFINVVNVYGQKLRYHIWFVYGLNLQCVMYHLFIGQKPT